jgi:hypothetical protein
MTKIKIQDLPIDMKINRKTLRDIAGEQGINAFQRLNVRGGKATARPKQEPTVYQIAIRGSF